jgi:hypothetical protein
MTTGQKRRLESLRHSFCKNKCVISQDPQPEPNRGKEANAEEKPPLHLPSPLHGEKRIAESFLVCSSLFSLAFPEWTGSS